MKTVIMELISNLRSSLIFKRILYYSIIFFLFAYTFSVPSFGESSSFLRFSIYISMVFLGSLTTIYCFLYEDFRINMTALLIPLFCIFSLIGTLLYSHQYRTWFSLVLLAISFFVFTYSFKILKNKHLIISIIALAFFAFSLYYIVYYRKEIIDFRSYTSNSFRLGWFFDNPNGVSAYAVVGFSSPLYLVIFWNKKIRFSFILPVLTSLLVGITTGSRTFLVIVGIVILIFLFFKFSKHKFIYLGIVAGLIVVGVLLLNLPFLSIMKGRLLRAIETLFGTASKVDTSTLERAVMIDYGFSLGSKRLFFGYGVDGFSVISGMGTYAHSNFAETICDFGLLGLVIFYLPLFIFFFKAITNKKIDKCFVITFFIYYLIVSFSNVIYYKKIYYLMISFLYYLVFIESASIKHKNLVSELNTLVFTCDSMGSGGAEKVISSLANEMVNRINVYIIGVADMNKPHSFYHLDDKVRYLTLPNNGGKRINPVKRIYVLKKMLKKINPDIVISFLPNANIYTWLSLLFTKIPHVTSERNNPYLNPKGKIVRLLKKLSFIFSNGSVFQTKDAMDYYPTRVKNRSVIIKNPIVVNQSLEPCLRNKTVLAVGRLTEQKNYKCLIDAFSLFNAEKNEEYTLKIYGDGNLKKELMGYCFEMDIADKVMFMGNDQNWHEKEYEDAMYVLSSDYEGMPNSLAEAMAIGIPSISTDCPIGGSRELIENGVNGYLVPVNNPKALAKTMVRLSNEDSSRFYNSTRNLVRDYSIETITAKWVEYIKGLRIEYYE